MIQTQSNHNSTALNDRSLWDSDFFIVSAPNRESLVQRVIDLQSQIDDDSDLPRLSVDLFQNLELNTVRLGIVASDAEDLNAKLQRAIDRLSNPEIENINDVSGIYFASQPMGPEGKIAFLMPGEGSQYVGMMADIAEALPESAAILELCDHIYSKRGKGPDESASRFFQRPDELSESQIASLETDLRRIDNAMFSVFIGDWIIYFLLEQMNVQCDVVAGHSAGELAALMATRCINGSEEQFERLSAGFDDLGSHRPEDANPSKLIALGKPSDVAQSVIDAAQQSAGRDLEAFVAMNNCPHQSVIVGLADDMQLVEDEVVRRGMVFQQLPLEQPYHTPLFKPYMRTLRKMFDEMPFQSPQVPIYSCTSAQPFPNDPDEIRQLTLAHWENPVRFTEMINNLYEDGVRTFIEVGPRNNLCSFVEDILRGKQALIVPTNVPRHSGLTQLNHVIARLLAHQIQINPKVLFASRGLVNHEPEPQAAQGEIVPHELVAGAPNATSASPGTQQTMQSYLHVMDQFLDTQASVMQEFLHAKNRKATSPGSRATRRKLPRRRSANRVARDYIEPVDASSFASANSHTNYPLLGTVVEHTSRESIVVQRVMDLDEDNFADHHTVGGRELSDVNPEKHGLPVVPMTFTLEMLCEVAQTLLPDQQVIAIESVSLFKWLAYEGVLSTVQVNASVIEQPEQRDDIGQSRINVELFQWREDASPDFKRPAATATIVLEDKLPAAPVPQPDPLQGRRPSEVDIETLYRNLFHGPLFQGVESVEYADNGVEGVVSTLPREGLFDSCDNPEFIFDPVLMDTVMHPMCAWHLEQPDQSGRILLPIGIERIEFFGNCPQVGEQFTSRTLNVKETSRQFAYDIEVIDSNGRLWCRMKSCSYWRFYLPFSEFNFHGPKNVYMLSTNWDHILALPDASKSSPDSFENQLTEYTCSRRFEVPTDLQNPSMQPVGAMVTLGESELQEFQQLELPAFEITQWLFSRVAAKDAVRVLWQRLTGERLFSADLEIRTDEHQNMFAQLVGRETPENFPRVVVANVGMMIGAVASIHPQIGIAIGKLGKTPGAIAEAELTNEEESMIAKLPEELQTQWRLRFQCAKRALHQALHQAVDSNAEAAGKSLHVLQFDIESGTVLLIDESISDQPIFVKTQREGSFVTATTLCLSNKQLQT